MKHRFSAIIAYTLLATSTLFGTEIPSKIRAVTVYPDRAVVTRAASTDLPAGTNELIFTGLPLGLLPESIQIDADANQPISLLDVRSETRHSTPETIDRLAPLVEEEKNLEEQIAEIDILLTALRQQTEFIAKSENAVTAPRTEGELPTPDQLAAFSRHFYESRLKLLPEIRAQEKAREKIDDRLQAVKKQIAETRGAERTETRAAIVRVETPNPVTAEFTLSYAIMNAGWTPAYNVRVNSAAKEIQLDYQGSITQRTGEDWSNVALTLSTARPSLGGTPPELKPWFLNIRPPARPAAPMLKRESLSSTTYFADDAAGSRFSFAPPPAAVEDALTSVNLKIPVAATIPADGQPHRVSVGTYPLEGEFQYTIVPRLSTHAFLEAVVVHPGPAPILPGETNLFFDGNFVGRSNLPRVDPEQEFDLPLGVDEAISIERQLLGRFVEERGIINKTTRTRFEFLTKIVNRRSTAETIVIKDQVPVSQHEEITVHLMELSGGQPEENEPGIYRWELTLAPNEEIHLPLTFAIDHPIGMDITGL